MFVYVKNYSGFLEQFVYIKDNFPNNIIVDESLKICEACNIVIFIKKGLSVGLYGRIKIEVLSNVISIITIGIPIYPEITFIISYKNNKNLLGRKFYPVFIKKSTSLYMLVVIGLILKMLNGGFTNARNL